MEMESRLDNSSVMMVMCKVTMDAAQHVLLKLHVMKVVRAMAGSDLILMACAQQFVEISCSGDDNNAMTVTPSVTMYAVRLASNKLSVTKVVCVVVGLSLLLMVRVRLFAGMVL